MTILMHEEAARHLRVSTSTLYRLLKQPGFPSHKVGKSRRYVQEELDAWLRERDGEAA